MNNHHWTPSALITWPFPSECTISAPWDSQSTKEPDVHTGTDRGIAPAHWRPQYTSYMHMLLSSSIPSRNANLELICLTMKRGPICTGMQVTYTDPPISYIAGVLYSCAKEQLMEISQCMGTVFIQRRIILLILESTN